MRQERDRLNLKAVVWTAVVTAIVGVLAVLWSGWLLERERSRLAVERREAIVERDRAESGAPRTAPREIGIVDQTQIRRERLGRTLTREKRQRLESFGWIDRERGIVHIPIERAFDIIVGEEVGP